jgi:Na+-driven multidrug efflux pump
MHTPLRQVGIWWAFPISNVLIAGITAAVYAKGDWKRRRLVEENDALAEQVAMEASGSAGASA